MATKTRKPTSKPETPRSKAAKEALDNLFNNPPPRTVDEPSAPSNWSKVPGYALIKRLREKQLELGDFPDELFFKNLEITHTAWNNFLNGTRNIATLTRHPGRLKWMASFLNLPPIAVRVLAGDINVDEFAVPINLDERLRSVIKELNQDPMWAVFAHESLESEWDTLPLKTRMLIVSLYQKSSAEFWLDLLEQTAGTKKDDDQAFDTL